MSRSLIMLAAITTWKVENRIGWFFRKGIRIQLHESLFPIEFHQKDLVGHLVEYDPADIVKRSVPGKTSRKIVLLEKILKVTPPP